MYLAHDRAVVSALLEQGISKEVLDKGLRTADNMSEGCTCLGCAAMGDAILAEM